MSNELPGFDARHADELYMSDSGASEPVTCWMIAGCHMAPWRGSFEVDGGRTNVGLGGPRPEAARSPGGLDVAQDSQIHRQERTHGRVISGGATETH